MIGGTNQSRSTVLGDQVARDKITNNKIVLEVKKELASAKQIITELDLQLNNFVNIDVDDDNTILIQKLRRGGFNSIARRNAKLQKIRTISVIVSMTKTENGKRILGDIYFNLMSIINTKYIVHMNEGETLKTSFDTILLDLSNVVNKYSSIISIDEAFLEGLLYVATSNCALQWLVEEDVDEDSDDC